MILTGHDRTTGPHPGLLDWLAGHGIEYELHEHPLTFTARETAAIEGIDPRRFAKTVVVETATGSRALLALDAVDRVDLVKAAAALRAEHVRLLSEAELEAMAPEYDVGTMPPIGELFGIEVLADNAIRDDPEITFHAGSHHFTVHVERAGWERATRVTYADLAERRDEPAWER
jgi:Ala-tRNA(Pro) deacylase